MAKITHCPVCGLALDAVERFGNRDAYHLTCQRCGRYGMSGTLLAVGFPTATGQQRAGLMAALRDATARGEEVLLSTDNWEGTATHFATFSIPQKLRRLLEYIGSKSQNRAGARVVINDQLEFPTFAATDVEEFNFLLYRRTRIGQRVDGNQAAGLTANAWRACAGERYPSLSISHSRL
jgi:hypothetical protein